jgi:hypothetical protein
MAAFGEAPLVAGGGNEPQHTAGASVSEEFFDVL